MQKEIFSGSHLGPLCKQLFQHICTVCFVDVTPFSPSQVVPLFCELFQENFNDIHAIMVIPCPLQILLPLHEQIMCLKAEVQPLVAQFFYFLVFRWFLSLGKLVHLLRHRGESWLLRLQLLTKFLKKIQVKPNIITRIQNYNMEFK